MASIPTIDAFKAQIGSGGGPALANLFYVELPFIPGTNLGAAERNLLCKASRIPGRQIATIDRAIGIENQKISVGYANADVTLSFHLLNDYKVRNYFEAWQNLTVDQESQQIKYANNYKFSTKIYQLKKGVGIQLFDFDFKLPFFNSTINFDIEAVSSSSVVYGVELNKSFPVTMNGIDLTDQSADTVVELSVDLSYKNWKRIR